jgi:acyl-CoA thioester hydrolase
MTGLLVGFRSCSGRSPQAALSGNFRLGRVNDVMAANTNLHLRDSRSTYPVWFEERIRNGDTDQFRHVNNTAIVGYCEAGRMALIADPAVQDSLAGLAFVVATLTVRFERELFYPGTVSIGTGVTKLGNSSFHVSQILIGPEGHFASSDAICVVLDKQSNKPIRIPDALRTYLDSMRQGQDEK